MRKKKLNINLPFQDIEVLIRIAGSLNLTPEEVAARALLDWLKAEQEKGKALLLDIGKGLGDGPPDLAAAHDHYLYGKAGT